MLALSISRPLLPEKLARLIDKRSEYPLRFRRRYARLPKAKAGMSANQTHLPMRTV